MDAALELLPNELLLLILTLLPEKQLASLCTVSWRFATLCDSDVVWRHRLAARFPGLETQRPAGMSAKESYRAAEKSDNHLCAGLSTGRTAEWYLAPGLCPIYGLGTQISLLGPVLPVDHTHGAWKRAIRKGLFWNPPENWIVAIVGTPEYDGYYIDNFVVLPGIVFKSSLGLLPSWTLYDQTLREGEQTLISLLTQIGYTAPGPYYSVVYTGRRHTGTEPKNVVFYQGAAEMYAKITEYLGQGTGT